MTYNPYQGNPTQYTGHLFFTGPGYTQPLPQAPQPTTPTGGLSSPTGGTGGTGGTGVDSQGAQANESGGQSTHGPDAGLGGNFAGPAAREGSAWDAVRNTASFLANPVGFTMAAMLDPTNPRPSLVGMAADALGLGGGYDGMGNQGGIGGYGTTGPGSYDPGVMGTPGGVEGRGNSGGTFGDWGGNVGVDWGGDPDGSGGSSGNTGGSDPGGTNGGTGNGPDSRRRGGLIGYARGGMPDPYISEGGLAMLSRGRRVAGPGGGQDDLVPAMLSTDEYVIPADVVAHLGDGNPRQGGLQIDRLVRNVRQHKTGNGGKHPPMAKPIERYMKGRR